MPVQLTNAHRIALEKAQAQCSECAIDIERARDAGVDLGTLPDIRDQLEGRVRDLLRVYFRQPGDAGRR